MNIVKFLIIAFFYRTPPVAAHDFRCSVAFLLEIIDLKLKRNLQEKRGKHCKFLLKMSSFLTREFV